MNIAADLPIFFNPDEFGETVAYTPYGSAEPLEIVAVFELTDGFGMTEDISAAKVAVMQSDVPTPGPLDCVVVSGNSWFVLWILSGDGGVWELAVRRGELRPVDFVRSANTPDGRGGVTDDTEPAFSALASVRPITAEERYQADQLGLEITHDILVRYDDRVAADQTIQFGSRVFEITGILNPDERNAVLRLRVRERLCQ